MKHQGGYLGIVTVLIVSAIALTIGVSIALLGINESLNSYGVDEGQDALQMADGCAEEGYFRLKADPAYVGGTIPYADGDCTLSISGGGSTRTIIATFSKGDYTNTLEVDVNLEENSSSQAQGIDLTAWEEQ